MEKFNLDNVPTKPFRKYHRTGTLIKLLLAMVSSKALVPLVFSEAVDEYNKSHESLALIEWLSDIIFEYNPRSSSLDEIEEMHNYMIGSGKYTSEEIAELDSLAQKIFAEDFYGRVLPDFMTMEAILRFYLRKYKIIENKGSVIIRG